MQNQSGTALVIALVILVVLTLISLSSSLTSVTEIKLSGNKRGSTDAFYTADGGVQATVAKLSNFDAATYTAIPNTGTVSQNIINQQVDTLLTQTNNSNGSKVEFADGVVFTAPPTVVIYHQNNTAPPVGLPFGGGTQFEYYIVDSVGADQADSISPSRSEVVTTVLRLIPQP
ncbi:MAG TPA: PilX N-terminal domain-containing pilus assembly protein [Thermodesulfobacteriota bacterium]|nr:PilX N-terminal domain-containing pilus assembly protein [Thermodesulfobacteriota bacterium]